MSRTIREGFRSTLRTAYKKQCQCIEEINLVVKGCEVRINNQKYEGCVAQIQEYYFDGGNEYVRVSIGGALEFVELKDCEFV